MKEPQIIDAEFVEEKSPTPPRTPSPVRRRVTVSERLELLADEAGEVEELVDEAAGLLGQLGRLVDRGTRVVQRAVGEEHRPILPR